MESQPFLLEHTCSSHHVQTVENIIKRVMSLTSELLPIQVDLDSLTSPTSDLLTQKVVNTYKLAGGDFQHILPYALLECRRRFKGNALKELSDSGEYAGRALACEALARKIVAQLPLKEQYAVISARYTCFTSDGEETIPSSVLESAVDQQAIFFLSSNEANRVVFALWKGSLVQKINQDGGGISYQIQHQEGSSFLEHFNVGRLAVPRYQFIFRFFLWVIFIIAYTAALQTNNSFGLEDYVLYVQLLGYILEEIVMIYKIRSNAFGFWNCVNWIIFSLLSVAFAYRIADLNTDSEDQSFVYRKLAFQILSLAAPLIWMRLLTIFDVFQYFGTLQIVLRRMLKESGIFFILLALLGIGFFQGLSGLDAVDGNQDSATVVFDSLVMAVLGSPTFELFDRGSQSYPFGAILYYSWSILVIILLLNVLIALFGSAYSDSIEDATEVYMMFFASKTVGMIRAPDQFVYVAPINLIEIFLISPLEFIFPSKVYCKINQIVMTIIFFIPLSIIAIFETYFATSTRKAEYLALLQEPDEFTEQDEDPEAFYDTNEFGPGEDREMIISKVPFEELKARLPSLVRSPEGEILYQISELRKEIEELRNGKKLK